MARRTEGKAKHRARGEAREGVTGSEAAMSARSIATLAVSFGMVSIPVKLFSATEASRAISFNLLHKGCGSRLRQQDFCGKEDVPVARAELVKGYEVSKDHDDPLE